MIVNPGVNAYPMSQQEVGTFKDGLKGIFNNPEINYVLSYGGNYVPGITDIDLLVMIRNTVTDKKTLLSMGKRILDLYECFGVRDDFPVGVEMDMHVHDEFTFSRGLMAYNRSAFERLRDSDLIAGKRPERMEMPKELNKNLSYITGYFSKLRQYPLLRGVISRFRGEAGLSDANWRDITTIAKLPKVVYGCLNDGKEPETLEEGVEFLERMFGELPNQSFRILLEARESLPKKMEILNSANSDEILLSGITYYEMVIESTIKKLDGTNSVE